MVSQGHGLEVGRVLKLFWLLWCLGFIPVFSALETRNIKCPEMYGTVYNNKEFLHQMPIAVDSLFIVEELNEPLFTLWSKVFQNFLSNFILLINKFFGENMSSLVNDSFCFLLWHLCWYLPFVPQIHSPPVLYLGGWPTGLSRTPHPLTCLLLHPLVSTAGGSPGKESKFWVSIPQESSLLGLSRLAVSLHGRWAVWQPSPCCCFLWPW